MAVLWTSDGKKSSNVKVSLVDPADGGGGGVTDHGELDGLDGDDHLQYQFAGPIQVVSEDTTLEHPAHPVVVYADDTTVTLPDTSQLNREWVFSNISGTDLTLSTDDPDVLFATTGTDTMTVAPSRVVTLLAVDLTGLGLGVVWTKRYDLPADGTVLGTNDLPDVILSGDNVTVVDNGDGTVTINSSGGGGGEQGPPGDDGLSAYEVALANDPTIGSPSDWLLSLVGPKGDKGDDGLDGEDGEDGADGGAGPQGPQGPTGVVSATSPITYDASTKTVALDAATTSAAGSMSAADKAKLDGVASNATANSSDATLLARANHTGTQALSTISDAGTAAAKNVPATGNASATEVVYGTDTRLTDTRTPADGAVTTAKIADSAVTPAKISTTGTSSAAQNHLRVGASGAEWAVSVVRAATTVGGGNVTLSGTQTIDGVALVSGDLVLVKNQTTSSQNGVYSVAAGSWTALTADTSITVTSGTTNAGSVWSGSVSSAPTPGTLSGPTGATGAQGVGVIVLNATESVPAGLADGTKILRRFT